MKIEITPVLSGALGGIKKRFWEDQLQKNSEDKIAGNCTHSA